MTGLQRSASLISLAAALILSTSGCSDPYTYFNVHISLDQTGPNYVDSNTEDNIASCLVFVLADGKKIEDPTDLRKLDGTLAFPGAVNAVGDVGVLDYSTIRSSGTLEFITSMSDSGATPKVIVQGSVSGDVKPSQIVSLELVASKCGGGGSQPACIDIH